MNKSECWIFEKVNKIGKALARLTKKKKDDRSKSEEKKKSKWKTNSTANVMKI